MIIPGGITGLLTGTTIMVLTAGIIIRSTITWESIIFTKTVTDQFRFLCLPATGSRGERHRRTF
jgi:hypothetical protein